MRARVHTARLPACDAALADDQPELKPGAVSFGPTALHGAAAGATVPSLADADWPELLERLQEVSALISNREMAAIAGISTESVRRYLHGQEPSVGFIVAVCLALDVSADWLLLGRGTQRGHLSIGRRAGGAAVRRVVAHLRREADALQAALDAAEAPPAKVGVSPPSADAARSRSELAPTVPVLLAHGPAAGRTVGVRQDLVGSDVVVLVDSAEDTVRVVEAVPGRISADHTVARYVHVFGRMYKHEDVKGGEGEPAE